MNDKPETSRLDPIISNPLRWQGEIDAAPAGINLKGFGRFWRTVEEIVNNEQVMILTDGAPDFSKLLVCLTETIGLELGIEEIEEEGHIPDMTYRFVDLNDKEQWYHKLLDHGEI
jgi:hypothetical protein